ncbi:hypothetical protein K8I61_17390 [bacterium]|nr:hypothetical protein [bacterium]
MTVRGVIDRRLTVRKAIWTWRSDSTITKFDRHQFIEDFMHALGDEVIESESWRGEAEWLAHDLTPTGQPVIIPEAPDELLHHVLDLILREQSSIRQRRGLSVTMGEFLEAFRGYFSELEVPLDFLFIDEVEKNWDSEYAEFCVMQEEEARMAAEAEPAEPEERPPE